MRSIVKICVTVLVLSAIAGCSYPCGNSVVYDARGVLDSDGNPHFILSNDHRNHVLHVWRDSGGLHKDEITSLPGERVEAVTWADTVLCAYTASDAGLFKGCKTDNAAWDVRNRLNVIPKEYMKYECLEITSRLNDGRIVMACTHPDDNPRVHRFFMVDDNVGSVNEFQPQLDVTRIINHDAAPFDHKGEPWLIQSLFFDEDTWDGNSFIYGVVFESKLSGNFTIRLYHVSHDDSGWTINKIGEIDSAGYRDIALHNEIFKGKRVTLAARQTIVKRDKSSGSVGMEAISSAFSSLYRDRHDRIAHIVTPDGRFHALFSDESRKETDIYYYVYNPDSPTPEVPETIEWLDSVGHR